PSPGPPARADRLLARRELCAPGRRGGAADRAAARPRRRDLPGLEAARHDAGARARPVDISPLLPAAVAPLVAREGGGVPAALRLRPARTVPHADRDDRVLRRALHRVS